MRACLCVCVRICFELKLVHGVIAYLFLVGISPLGGAYPPDIGRLIASLAVFSGPSLNVLAKRIREASVGGATFEMGCTVALQNLGEVGYSVLIQSQDSLESNVRTIMTLSPDNVLQHGGATDPNRRYEPDHTHRYELSSPR